ncbi:hypothetical protein BDN70DRAFT_898242 [Pholiota conissans]|uniref:Uncharacterized protein n=1 Tax=Pholiota conissans TaxID=109636 RepID=A0A9P5YTU8_9AGAR|nr:hypothetical protein BDN70DRAFT_898242 [Pholiota conissans]
MAAPRNTDTRPTTLDSLFKRAYIPVPDIDSPSSSPHKALPSDRIRTISNPRPLGDRSTSTSRQSGVSFDLPPRFPQSTSAFAKVDSLKRGDNRRRSENTRREANTDLENYNAQFVAERVLPMHIHDYPQLTRIITFGRTDGKGYVVPVPLIECLKGTAKVNQGDTLVFDGLKERLPKHFFLEISWPGYPSCKKDLMATFTSDFPKETPFTKQILAHLIAKEYYELYLMHHGVKLENVSDDNAPGGYPFYRMNFVSLSLWRDGIWRIDGGLPRAWAKVDSQKIIRNTVFGKNAKSHHDMNKRIAEALKSRASESDDLLSTPSNFTISSNRHQGLDSLFADNSIQATNILSESIWVYPYDDETLFNEESLYVSADTKEDFVEYNVTPILPAAIQYFERISSIRRIITFGKTNFKGDVIPIPMYKCWDDRATELIQHPYEIIIPDSDSEEISEDKFWDNCPTWKIDLREIYGDCERPKLTKKALALLIASYYWMYFQRNAAEFSRLHLGYVIQWGDGTWRLDRGLSISSSPSK